MADPRILANMISANVSPNDNHESASSILPLPLNLIALIISYVRPKPQTWPIEGAYSNASLIAPQTSPACVGHAVFSIT